MLQGKLNCMLTSTGGCSQAAAAPRRGLLLAFGMLAAGLAIYAFARTPDSAWLPAAWRFPLAGVAGGVGLLGSAPSFLHACAFSLLTAVAAGSTRYAAICAAWAGINALFELGQHPTVAPALIAALPDWFAQVPLLDRVGAFFGGGTFDRTDMAAAALGALVAWYWLTTSTAAPDVRNPAGDST